MNKNIILALNESLQMSLPEKVSRVELKEKLSGHINQLIQTDFQKLVNILYRIDINESELKRLLKENSGTDAGDILAQLIIKRQMQKIKFRQQFHDNSHIPEDEKW